MIGIQRPAKLGSAHYVFTRPIASIPFPTKGDLRQIAAWDAWAHAHGGLDADRSVVRVLVQGNSELPVVLTGVTIDVTRRAAAPKGVYVVPFGGGPLGVRYFDVNLDGNPPVVRSVKAEFTDQPAIDFPYTVSQTDPEVLDIAASTAKCDCSWRAMLHWVYRGKSDVTVIDDHGRPFRTVSGSARRCTSSATATSSRAFLEPAAEPSWGNLPIATRRARLAQLGLVARPCATSGYSPMSRAPWPGSSRRRAERERKRRPTCKPRACVLRLSRSLR